MTERIQYIAGGLLLVLLIAGGGFYVYRDFVPFPETAQSQNSPATTTPKDRATVSTPSPADATAVELQSPIPDLDRPIVFPAGFPEEAKALMREKMTTLIAILKGNPAEFGAWIDLGIRRKQVEDFEGARQAWEYAGALQPGNNISFLNLGILYHYYLKDFPMAEQNLRLSLVKDPRYPQVYQELHDLYRYSYKQETGGAIEILKEGIKATGNINFVIALAKYYRDVKNDTVNARIYFTEAKEQATETGNSELAAALEEELAALPK
ncbi:hypothetical protein A2761_00325 [Candidatus Kaiserbacteria bacterium RIFCSPHIGHO2_01_FULL_51_33]|uniref:Uncharacterized protein n=1 Tax=Candidatus Kaiserbacteria bacterium RIFCSPLOWO2_01_FULL_51_21 TaxID=1798508 RepID=A0A1F6ECF1_9BACT|nr:MAG: hypothetical protein A2761_00325 [Candidatus Kaiserbacteria bacterium RIFCSPHIGHO2_01_FULL_51_33]OGG71348.1 MAG: hypothetical protein A3A35_00055 [Candidatus Kaiserbacteria bacterium RIFCSPLOWO2_01_FULL_51_21]